MRRKEKDSNYEALKKIRGDWGGVNPVTKIIPNKKRYKRKEKHVKRNEEEASDTNL